MENVHTRPLSAITSPAWRSWLPQALLLVSLLLGLSAYLPAPFLALEWMQTPFIGAFTGQGLIFSGAGPTGDASGWSAFQQGLRLEKVDGKSFSSQLQAIDGQPVHSAKEMHAVLSRRQVGQTVALQVLTSEGQTLSQQVTLSRFPLHDRFGYFYAPYAIGLVYLFVAIWMLAVRRDRVSGQLLAFFCISAAVSTGLTFDWFTTRALTLPWLFAVLLAGATSAAVLVILVRALLQQHRPAFAMNREQSRWVALAALFSFLPILTWLAGRALGAVWAFHPALFYPLPVFPLAAGVAVQDYRVTRSDLALRVGLQYGIMAVMVAAGYALLAAGLGLITSRWVPGGSPLLTGLIFFFIALAFNPLREWVQNAVDVVFFRSQRVLQKRLQTFSGEITRAVGLPGIVDVLRRSIEESLHPSRLHVYLYDSLSDQYTAAADSSGLPTSDLRFSVTSGLAMFMNEQQNPAGLSGKGPLPETLEPDRARLALLGAQAFVAIPGRQRLTGWLALGPRLSGEPYTQLQLGLVKSMNDQAALAIERAQIVENMEKRVREMNMLTRVAQGVIITLTLDDILELVYAQTTQIIPAHSFRIMLYEAGLDVYQYAFYLSGEDRIIDKENHPVQAGQALEQEIIRQRRVIFTDDYNAECQRRGIYIAREDLYAWMGVPLNAGAETIGALSLGNTDPELLYTSEQRTLLQAVADQVAGALVKARLLQETERRARQLSSLNEVTRKLTSTLETAPLLQSILESAVSILNCEAGSLLMVDAVTDDLVFEVTAGPVAGSLANRRMPAGQGVAGSAVRTGEAVLVNDVSRFPEWFSQNDERTGFITRALMAVPLKVKEKVIGVIEVINKLDGTFFTPDDQELLSGFASQAVVALENARLYTLTDQALAARVEELSVMQRIDRELNTSLDTTTAMRITLEWAMRQSGSNAGLVAVLSEGSSSDVRVMASQGYTRELDEYTENPLPAAEFGLVEGISSGAPLRRWQDGRTGVKTLLSGGKSQAILPIRRDTFTIGLLLLESLIDEPVSDEIMGFLSRLTDHASIAISNAQLYAAVQQANLAKSDFVSFVAHELKNPMTSVKGYTELISAGAVGPVSDIQANFLATIRHNIERMNTLVSDLNDMSKIEVGRLRLDFKSTGLLEVIDSVVRSTRKQLEEKEQTLVLNIPAGLSPVWADRIRLEQVLVNLVSNAHKYTPAAGEIEVAAEYCPNQWDPGGAANVIHLWVKDNGIGISEEDQKKIFQKFFRSEDPKTREATGAGLGLNITRSLVEMQGGKIWFESEFRKGTTFHFTVPISETG